jgi:hypothetical protein
MRIAVHHLTRMQKGFMCVAGIDLETGRSIRPVLDRQMRIDMLACHGGPFELGRVVDLGETRFVGRVPEIEDRQFDASQARVDEVLAPGHFRQLLESVALERLDAIFGRELQNVGTTCAVNEQRGLRSLGCVWASHCELRAETNQNGTRRIRLTLDSDRGRLQLPVTDIRLYGDDHVTVDELKVTSVAEPLRRAERVLLSVGLSRPYRRAADQPARHWLQVNNIHSPGLS